MQLIEAIIFVPRAHFLRGGLALLHSKAGEGTVVSLTKVKKKK